MARVRAACRLVMTITGIIWLCSGGAPTMAQTLREQRKPEQAPSPGKVRFEVKSALDGISADGFRFSSEIWESSDGVAVFLRRQYCRSPRNADRALRRRANSASSILETTLLKDKRGVKSGRRAVVSFGDTSQQSQMILWTDGEMLYTVESPSFEHALLFEKMLPGI